MSVCLYDDLPAGETDAEMAKFSLGPDRADVIPVLKEILAIRPGIKDLGITVVCSGMDEDKQ